MLYTLPPESIEDYKRDGVIVLRKVLSPNEVEEIRQGINYNIKNLSPLKMTSSECDGGRVIQDFFNWHRIPEFRQTVFNPKLGIIASSLMESKECRLHHDHTMLKEPNTNNIIPWHQDQKFYNIQGRQTATLWMPVDYIPLESAIRFISGSHRGPDYIPDILNHNNVKCLPDGRFEKLPDMEKIDSQLNILSWEMEPGDILCYNTLLLHSAKGSKFLRRTFGVKYIGDDILHAPRPWSTIPPFTGLEKELPAGVPMNHPLFPIIYSSCSSHI